MQMQDHCRLAQWQMIHMTQPGTNQMYSFDIDLWKLFKGSQKSART